MIEIPTTCPVCNSAVVREGPKIFCRNEKCGDVVIKKLQHFAKILGIKGMGPASIKKLGFKSLPEIYKADNAFYCEKLGSALGNKLYREVAKTFSFNVGQVLPALAIPSIGPATVSKIIAAYDSYEDIDPNNLSKVIGPAAAENLLVWMETEDYILDSLPFKLDFEKPAAYKATVCITGRLKSFKTKAAATVELNKHGYKVVANLTKEVDILINEDGRTSTKLRDAQKRGVQVINNIGVLLI